MIVVILIGLIGVIGMIMLFFKPRNLVCPHGVIAPEICFDCYKEEVGE